MLKYLRVLAVAVPLAACSAVTGGGTIAAIASSPIGTSLLNAVLNTLAPGVNQAIAKGVSAAGPELRIVGYALPWAKQTLDLFGPVIGIPAATLARVDAEIVSAEALVANPPTDAALAVAAGVKVWQDVMVLIQPAVAAAPPSVARRV